MRKVLLLCVVSTLLKGRIGKLMGTLLWAGKVGARGVWGCTADGSDTDHSDSTGKQLRKENGAKWSLRIL